MHNSKYALHGAGVTEDAIRGWAYVLFGALAAASPAHSSLVEVLRGQLGVDEARAKDVVRLLKHVECKYSRLLDT